MSKPKEVTITIALRPEHTLAESWTRLAESLAGTGAHKDQIDMMRIMFFMGAGQAYARIDGNARSFESFCDIMKDIHVEIDDVLVHSDIGRVAGHA